MTTLAFGKNTKVDSHYSSLLNNNASRVSHVPVFIYTCMCMLSVAVGGCSNMIIQCQRFPKTHFGGILMLNSTTAG